MTVRSMGLRLGVQGAALLASALVGQAALAYVTVPITAASFPKEAMPTTAGKIEFWAKLSGVSGPIRVGGGDPYFFQIAAPFGAGHSVYHLGFNSNDGRGNGGLTAIGDSVYTGPGGFGSSTYEDVLGAGHVNDWHKYVFQWNKDGLPSVADGRQQVAVFVDGVLNSGRWDPWRPATFEALTAGTLNLITTGGPLVGRGQVAVDELKIYDGADRLLLWSTLGSADEISHSAVGLNGSFNGGGGAGFVEGVSGMALMARPVGGLADTPPVPEPASLVVMSLGAITVLGWRRVTRTRRAAIVASQTLARESLRA